jgi:hypothetical protein
LQKPIEQRAARLGPGQRLFIEKILDTYRRVKFAEPISAYNPDPVTARYTSKWTPQGCHLAVDIEHAVRVAAADQPDTNKLREAWTQLVEDDEIARFSETEIRLIKLLIPILQIRELDPMVYFKPTRRAA